MGPFGIAAVGLLANKGSGAKKKKNCNGWEDHSMKPESCSDACSTGTTNAAGNTTTPKCAAKESLHRKETATKEHCEFVRKEKLHDVIYHYGVSGAVNTREGHDKSERFFPKKGTRWKADLSEGCTSVCKGGSAIASQKSLTQIRTSRSPVCVRIVTSASDTSLQGEISNAQSSDALMPANDSNWHDIGEGETDGHPSVNHSAGLNKLRRSTKIKTESINEYFEKTQDASGHDSWTESCPKLQEHASLKKLNSYQCDLGHQKNDQAYISTSDNKSQDIGSSLAVGSKTDLPSGLFLTGPSLTTNTARSTLSGVSVDNITSKEAAGHSEGSLREADSPRFKALLHLTSGLQKKRLPSEMTSFSHELSSSGFGSHSFWRQHNAKSSEAVTALEARFYNAKKEVDLELAVFAADLLDVMESEAGNQDEISQARQEDLLILAQKCSVMPAEAFRKQCECIVQKLDDERQSLPIGRLKQLHTRMLFILTRCTRLLQYQKESAVPKDKMVLRDSRSGLIGINSPSLLKISTKQYYSQEQQVIDWRNNSLLPFCSPSSKVTNNLLSDLSTPEKVSVPHLNSKFLGNDISRISSDSKVHAPSIICDAVTSRKSQKEAFMLPAVSNKAEALLLDKRVQTGNLDDMVICRICEDEVPTVHLEEHSRVCALAFHCDVKGFSVDDRLHKLADILVGLLDSHTPHSSVVSQGASPDIFKPSIFSESTLPKLSDCYHKNIDDSPDNTLGMDAMSFKSLFGTKSEVSHASSSAGSLTPRSPITNLGHFGVQLAERISLSEVEDTAQISELADIARCVARIRASDNGVLEYLVLCAQDLQDLFKHCSYDALTFQTFGKRIEKLLREKYLQIREYSTEMNTLRAAEEAQQCFQTDNYQSIRTASSHPPYKDRTSIDDFEIIKPISRGAYGRVFLAKKRTTGDLFAIKVLRKADMIRKNAVESILAERNILISTCNPFVVRFFYSFTCSENLYLVMEYLLGGDLYSLLRNVGCLDENITRIYMAEVVLALEYLHSLGVVHRDLKPDNLLIGQNGHIKLTDFGLSKVGLINSTDDLSGPIASGSLSSLNQNSEVNLDHSLSSREQRQKHTAVGTPDYLAPEILLGTGHGSSADWWSTGIILFECLTGVPPFNAENPQRIFDSILNRKIPWPHVPEEMSNVAKDLIDKLLTEDPNTRLGAKGAAEVKNHPFFDGVNWDTLARQKAAFIPNPESPHDTSYFTCRHDWNASEDIIKSASEASRNANRTDGFCDYVASSEHVDEPTALVEFASSSPSRFSFSNFSFKNLPQLVSINYDLLMQTGKDTAGFQSHR